MTSSVTPERFVRSVFALTVKRGIVGPFDRIRYRCVPGQRPGPSERHALPIKAVENLGCRIIRHGSDQRSRVADGAAGAACVIALSATHALLPFACSARTR